STLPHRIPKARRRKARQRAPRRFSALFNVGHKLPNQIPRAGRPPGSRPGTAPPTAESAQARRPGGRVSRNVPCSRSGTGIMHAHRIYGPGPEEPEPLRPVPDLGGAPVDDVEGRYAGEIKGSLIDDESGLIRYLDLDLTGSDRHVLVPIGHTRLERDLTGRLRIHLLGASRDELRRIPPYEPGRAEPAPTFGPALLEAHGRLFHGERYYAHPAYDHRGLYAGEHPIVRGPVPEPGPALRRLGELEGYRVARGEPDIRGWPLTAGEHRVGHV